MLNPKINYGRQTLKPHIIRISCPKPKTDKTAYLVDAVQDLRIW